MKRPPVATANFLTKLEKITQFGAYPVDKHKKKATDKVLDQSGLSKLIFRITYGILNWRVLVACRTTCRNLKLPNEERTNTTIW